MQELNKHNTEAVEQALKYMNAHILEQQIRINGFNNTISTMSERMNQLEQMVVLQKVQSTGRGPSVK